MDLKDIRPKSTERMLLVGATGTGKTTLARKLIQSHIADNKKHPVIIIDPKCTYDPEDDRFKLVTSPFALRWQGRQQFIHYRPAPDYQDVKSYDSVYKWIFARKEILVYTDETYMTMRGQRSPQWQTACVTCGRELGIGMLFATQRPSGIDLRIYTESEHKICFYLAHDDDRKRMAQEMGKAVMVDPVAVAEQDGSPHPHAFWKWNSRDRVTRLAELNLGGKKSGV
jgi:energy-coupling factor transporter ATP-binding protein EcfA2